MGLEQDIKQSKFKNEFSKVVVNLIFTNNWMNETQSKMFKKNGLTSPQFNVLRILRGQYPKPVTINLIIDRMLDRMSNASRIVDKLEKKGLVVRKQCASDRRAVDVIISEDGLNLLEDLDNEMRRWEENFQSLSENECIELNRLLDKLRA